MIYLMNSAVMPAGNYGLYVYRPGSVDDLRAVLRGEHGEWASRVGYPQNIDLIREWTGATVPLSREVTQFAASGDRAFVMRIKGGRIMSPATKGAPVSSALSDWEFAWVEFSAT